MQKVFSLVCCLGLLLGSLSTVHAASFGFSVQSDGDDSLYRINLNDGSQTQIGTDTGFNDVEGLAFDPTMGLLYGADDSSNKLITIDLVTGVGTAIGALGITGSSNPGLAIDSAGNMFLFDEAGTDELYSVNKATGAATLIGATSVDVDGLAFLGTTLFGLDADTDSLYTVDTGTGAASLVGALGLGISPQTGLAADGTNLWGIDQNGRILRIDPATGAAVQTATTMRGFEGLAIQPQTAPAAVPEPSTMLLLGTGLAGLAAWRMKKTA